MNIRCISPGHTQHKVSPESINWKWINIDRISMFSTLQPLARLKDSETNKIKMINFLKKSVLSHECTDIQYMTLARWALDFQFIFWDT